MEGGGGTHIIRVDVQRPLGDAHVPQRPPQQVVLERARRDIAVLTRHLRRYLGLGALRECALAGRVDDGCVRARAVGGHDVHGPAERAVAGGHLGQGGAGHGGDVGHHVKRVLALALGSAQAVHHGVFGLEDGSVDFRLGVGARARDHTALDAQGGGVTACVSGLDIMTGASLFVSGAT